MQRILLSCLVIMLFSTSSYADDAVVATVNGVAISAGELEAEVNRLISQTVYHGKVSEERREEFRETAIAALVDKEMQYQDARARGMKPDKKAVKAQLTKIRDQFTSKKEYKAALARANMTEKQLVERVEKAVLVQNVIKATVLDAALVSEAEIKDHYERNIAKFKQPESVKLRLISTKDEKKASEALALLKAGDDFGALAATMSEDKYRVAGGDLGYQRRGKLLPEIENAAFDLKPGEISGLIKAEDLWFIIKVEDKKPEQQMTLDESRDKIKKDLESRRAKEIYDKWMAELRAKAKIEVLWKAADQTDGKPMNSETKDGR